jgi:predicted RNase H-like nuclease (RuvC/YqgF family)
MIPKLKHMTVVIEELRAAIIEKDQEIKELTREVQELKMDSLQDLGR